MAGEEKATQVEILPSWLTEATLHGLEGRGGTWQHSSKGLEVSTASYQGILRPFE